MTAHWRTPAGLHTSPARLPVEGRLPSFDGATGWLNSPPLTTADLHGKVILVNFWTYTCINWLRQLPYLRAWAGKYADHSLAVIGVHTPEFGFEHELANVRRAVHDMRIDYPVALDNDYAVWSAFDNHYWPALYFADAQGRIRHHHFGEGEYQQSEMVIQQLLTEAGTTDHDHELVSVEARGAEAPADWATLRSPENYTGYERTENFASPGGIQPGQPHHYTPPGGAEAQPLGPGGRLDDPGRGRQARHGRRADHLPVPGPRPQPGHGTGRAGNASAVPGAPRRAAARPRSRNRRGRPRLRHPRRAATVPARPAARARHRAHLPDHVPRPRRRSLRLHLRVDQGRPAMRFSPCRTPSTTHPRFRDTRFCQGGTRLTRQNLPRSHATARVQGLPEG